VAGWRLLAGSSAGREGGEMFFGVISICFAVNGIAFLMAIPLSRKESK
jgi:hypothetical protein